MDSNSRKLLDGGFIEVGMWSLSEDGIVLGGDQPTGPGVYAFLLDGEVVYVGLTQSGLRNRMRHYRIGHQRQRTSARVKELIKQELLEQRVVTVFMCTPGNTQWNGLPMDIAPGLEAGLIKLIKPLWNIQGKK